MMKTKAILGGLILAIIIFGIEMSPATEASNNVAALNLSFASESFQTKSSCDIEAYLNDPDKSGTNIRSQPDKNSSVVKLVKTENEMVAKITGSQNGWFEVSVVDEVGDDDRNLFKGRGWIHSSVLGIDVAYGEKQWLYAQNSKKSRTLMRLMPDQTQVKLVACKGTWAQVKTGKLTGWMAREAQCSNPLTTCS